MGTLSQPAAESGTITKEMLIRALEKLHATRSQPKNLDPNSLLAKQTHLHLNGKNITHIAMLHLMKSLEVLYLYDNAIEVMGGVATLQHLTHIYLQNNYITVMAGLDGLTNLTKIYLQVSHCGQSLPTLTS